MAGPIADPIGGRSGADAAVSAPGDPVLAAALMAEDDDAAEEAPVAPPAGPDVAAGEVGAEHPVAPAAERSG